MCCLLLALATGCMAERGYTLVEKHVTPGSFKFVTVVEKTEPGAGGWRVACLYLSLQHDMGPNYLCKMGVEVPIETTLGGVISEMRARRVAADSANAAADLAFGPMGPETPLGIACSSFRTTYDVVLRKALKGSRVRVDCRAEAEALLAPKEGTRK
jgi:hypothetical protein